MRDITDDTRVLIVDDHPVMREGLRHAIEQEDGMTVVGEAVDGAAAVTQFELLRPHVVLMDLQMPKMSGLQAIVGIRAVAPDARIVVLTTYSGDARIKRAMSLGATCYLLKLASIAEIVGALRSAAAGHTVVPAEMDCDPTSHRGMESLTARELSVLKLVACGIQNRRIGASLHVSEQTVKSRIKNILAKLDARDRTHAVTIAVRRGFIDGY